jgi:phosphatidylserine/phosphatidylglycerophosphate/cardiolipin synthase-like enzyme
MKFKITFYITKLIWGIALSVILTNPALCMDKKEKYKPHMPFSPMGEKSAHYEGIGHIEEIKGVRVSSCVSLGDGCIDKLNHILKESDQFIVSFMYRFNSPTLLKTLKNKHLEGVPVVTFLDYTQTYESSSEGSNYPKYVQKLMDSVPTSLVKLKNRPFHHKITIAKSAGKEAIVIIGSANATFESDNVHSEDLIFIQSNKLASFYLNNFQKLLRTAPKTILQPFILNKPIAEIYHEHKLPDKTSNTDALIDFAEKVTKPEKVTLEGFHADVVSAGISPGGGSPYCIDIVNNILKQPNELLFMFENYISLDESLEMGEIGQQLLNQTPKFIVLDRNKHNRKSSVFLQKGKNKVLLFKPFSGGKFHHKLIISYPKEGDPIVYTGSFHLSTSSIKKNSEDIIGIRSAELADQYLANILENSGLGEIPDIWKFIFRYPALKQKPQKNMLLTSHQPLQHSISSIPERSEVVKVARKLQTICSQTMERYADRLDRVHDDLGIVAQGATTQEEIGKYFEHFQREFSHEETEQKEIALKELHEYIFEKELAKIFIKSLKENSQIIENAYTFLPKFPLYKHMFIGVWLDEANEWIKWARHLQEVEDEVEVDIEAQLSTIETVYAALYDLETYVTSFGKLQALYKILQQITKEK